VAALLNTLGLSSVAVMRSSGGAAFAASFAINHPSRSKSLVLLCPQVHRWDHRRWLPATSRWTLPLLKRPLLRSLLLGLYRLKLRRMTVAGLLKTEAGDRYADVATDPAATALCGLTLEAMRHGVRSAGFENDCIVFTNEDILGPDTVVETPTLLLHDEVDPLAPADHVAWFAAGCRTCERVPLRAAGHLIWVGPDADRMHRTRVRFLNEHAGRAAS
jgi:pimeloyl-ACP methyl ester carboxylesterase